jgi:hypothetical protein
VCCGYLAVKIVDHFLQGGNLRILAQERLISRIVRLPCCNAVALSRACLPSYQVRRLQQNLSL